MIEVAMPNLLAEAKAHFNEPILIGFNVGRVIGYAEDDDCYLIIHEPRRGKYWHTFVGGYIYLDHLKNHGIVIPKNPSYDGEIWNDYSRLDSALELNGAPKAEHFIISVKHSEYHNLETGEVTTL